MECVDCLHTLALKYISSAISQDAIYECVVYAVRCMNKKEGVNDNEMRAP